MLSQQSKYALRAALYLHLQEDGAFISVEEIAYRTDLPAAYLSKILKALSSEKIIISKRGKNGGVQLNHRKKKTTFFDICAAVKDPVVQSECVLFKKPCEKLNPCPFHASWSETKSRLVSFLRATSLG